MPLPASLAKKGSPRNGKASRNWRRTLPQIAEKLRQAKVKAQKKFQASARSSPVNLPVDAMTIESGFLLNQDDTSCLQLQKIAPMFQVLSS